MNPDIKARMNVRDHRVLVLGASPNPQRYSNQAVRLLAARGYAVVPVHPKALRIEGFPVISRLEYVSPPIHTLTLYVGPRRIESLIEAIVKLEPGRVIFNPGTKSRELEKRLSGARIPFVHGCTLVMLRLGTF